METQNRENRAEPWRPSSVVEKAAAEQNNKKPKRTTLKRIIWAIIGVLIFIIIVQVAIADKYSAQVLVIEGEKKVGVNPTDERLDFGDLSADTSATRYVTLNAGGIDTFIFVLKFGSIAELVKLSENNFTMKKGDEKKLEFSLYMPVSAPIGEKYTGFVWIFKLPKAW
ncbi:hypothetical protein KAI52_02535 [Candidatus Parcubacteria bacterium]|nr:hypothetical protein [Candidatus Parcubacteria bacterium]